MLGFDFHISDEEGRSKLLTQLTRAFRSNPDIVILCIGTDRSPGDSLGPLVGTFLSELYVDAHVYGTLERPVHATNLADTISAIQYKHPNAYILAIDACLGKIETIENIIFRDQPLEPGLALKKVLPSVGNASLMGIVNVGGYMEYLVLQNTRLTITYKLARVMSGIIAQAMIARTSLKCVAIN